MARSLTEEDRQKFIAAADHAVQFGQFSLQVFNDIVLKNPDYVRWIMSDTYTHETYYMGMVDKNNQANFYDGDLRIIRPDGKELVKFAPRDYLRHIAEHVESWSYVKFCYLKNVGWKGFVGGPDSGVYAVGPLARLNVSEGMATPLAHKAYEHFYSTLEGKPVHHTLATHWARLIEMLYAAERLQQLARDASVVSSDIRNIPTEEPHEGVGVVEAPRGTLIHHYQSDAQGLITGANLIVASQNNSARIAMSVDKSAKGLIREGKVDDGLLNMVEMAFRAYDPCNGCATHALPGQMPLLARIYGPDGRLLQQIERGEGS